jgi:hypothetical protein
MGRFAPVAWDAELAHRQATLLNLRPLVRKGHQGRSRGEEQCAPAKPQSLIIRVPDWSTTWRVRRVGYVVSDMGLAASKR